MRFSDSPLETVSCLFAAAAFQNNYKATTTTTEKNFGAFVVFETPKSNLHAARARVWPPNERIRITLSCLYIRLFLSLCLLRLSNKYRTTFARRRRGNCVSLGEREPTPRNNSSTTTAPVRRHSFKKETLIQVPPKRIRGESSKCVKENKRSFHGLLQLTSFMFKAD